MTSTASRTRRAAPRLPRLLPLLLLALASSTSFLALTPASASALHSDCASCPESYAPVCTPWGAVLLNACVARCQGVDAAPCDPHGTQHMADANASAFSTDTQDGASIELPMIGRCNACIAAYAARLFLAVTPPPPLILQLPAGSTLSNPARPLRLPRHPMARTPQAPCPPCSRPVAPR